MIQLCMEDRMKTSEGPFPPVSIIFTACGCCAVVLQWTYMSQQHSFKHFQSLSCFNLLFFAEVSHWKKGKMSLWLNDRNFSSLTSLQ